MGLPRLGIPTHTASYRLCFTYVADYWTTRHLCCKYLHVLYLYLGLVFAKVEEKFRIFYRVFMR
eukprot:COSAG05_NODE_16267_length_350_cov_0.569721_1_plen_63_part_10